MEVGVALAVELPVLGHGVEEGGQDLSLGPLAHPREGDPRVIGRCGTIRDPLGANSSTRGLRHTCRLSLGHVDHAPKFPRPQEEDSRSPGLPREP